MPETARKWRAQTLEWGPPSAHAEILSLYTSRKSHKVSALNFDIQGGLAQLLRRPYIYRGGWTDRMNLEGGHQMDGHWKDGQT